MEHRQTSWKYRQTTTFPKPEFRGMKILVGLSGIHQLWKIFLLARSKVGCTHVFSQRKLQPLWRLSLWNFSKTKNLPKQKTTGERLPQQQPHMLEDMKGAYQVTKKIRQSFSTVSLPKKGSFQKAPTIGKGYESHMQIHVLPWKINVYPLRNSIGCTRWLGNFCTTNPRNCVQDGAP